MKISTLIVLCLLFPAAAFTQLNLDYYLVRFTDKNGSPYSVSQPEKYLSQKAIVRRTKFQIPVTSQDFPVNPQYIQAVQDIGVKIIQTTKWLNAIVIKTSDTSKLRLISGLPFVIKVVKNMAGLASVTEPLVPSATESMPSKSTSSIDYGQAYAQISMVGGIPLHDRGFRGQGLSIAVLDGGFTGTNFMKAFDSLRANGQVKGTLNLVGGGTYVYQGTPHGSNVLSVLAANLSGIMVGTAPKADYYLIRSEDTNGESLLEEYNWVTGAEYADSCGVDIISTSLGYILPSEPDTQLTFSQLDGKTAPITIAAGIAMSKGMIVFATAGNNGENQSWPHVGFPADGDSVFAIGAADAHGIRASFSSPGPTYDGRMKPDVMAMGVGTTVMQPNGNVGYADGTSFSTPIIAGLTACLWQANPGKTNMEILAAIRKSCNLFNSPDSLMGDGIPDFSQADRTLSGISQTPDRNGITVSPNPFSDRITVCFPRSRKGVVTAEIIGTDSRALYRKTGIRLDDASSFSIGDLSSLKEGVYLLRIGDGDKSITIKIIKTDNSENH